MRREAQKWRRVSVGVLSFARVWALSPTRTCSASACDAVRVLFSFVRKCQPKPKPGPRVTSSITRLALALLASRQHLSSQPAVVHCVKAISLMKPPIRSHKNPDRAHHHCVSWLLPSDTKPRSEYRRFGSTWRSSDERCPKGSVSWHLVVYFYIHARLRGKH